MMYAILRKFLYICNNKIDIMLANFGKSSMKVGNAVESLAKTDDMLAIIGVIMLLGVVFSAYGSLWQGLLASKQYKEECSPNVPQKESSKKVVFALIGGVLIGALIIYVLFRMKSKKPVTLALA